MVKARKRLSPPVTLNSIFSQIDRVFPGDISQKPLEPNIYRLPAVFRIGTVLANDWSGVVCVAAHGPYIRRVSSEVRTLRDNLLRTFDSSSDQNIAEFYRFLVSGRLSTSQEDTRIKVLNEQRRLNYNGLGGLRELRVRMSLPPFQPLSFPEHSADKNGFTTR